MFGGAVVAVGEVVAEPVKGGFENLERLGVSEFIGGVGTSRGEGDLDVDARGVGCRLDGGASAQHDEVRHRDLLVATGAGVERGADLGEGVEDRGESRGVVDRPVPLGGETHPGTVGPAALVGAAERRR